MVEDRQEINSLLVGMTHQELRMVSLFCSSLIQYRDDKLAMIPVLMMLVASSSPKAH